MDSLEALYGYTSAASATAAAQAAQTGQATGAAAEVSFEEMLAALGGVNGQSGADSTSGLNQMQQYLLSGVADGSLTITDSQRFVSALTGTLTGEMDASGMDFLSSIDTSTLSADTLTSLMGLQQNTEENWVQQIVDAMSTTATEEGGEEDMQAYYQAMAALAEAQKKTLL